MTSPKIAALVPPAHIVCPPTVFVRIERRNADGRLIGNEMHRNLLNSTWWGIGRNADAGPAFTRPGFFPNEIGADE